jgi:hypothetical protein
MSTECLHGEDFSEQGTGTPFPIPHSLTLFYYLQYKSCGVSGEFGCVHGLEDGSADAVGAGSGGTKAVAENVFTMGEPTDEEIGERVAWFFVETDGVPFPAGTEFFCFEACTLEVFEMD